MKDKQSKYWVFTDLDGTLLDHETYSAEAAKSAISALGQLDAVIVPVTSKTQEEVRTLMSKLHISSPFVVENGAAVYIPNDFLGQEQGLVESDHGDNIKVFAWSRAETLDFITRELKRFAHDFKTFSAMGVQGIMEATGLPEHEAIAANKRLYSEPILWTGNDKDKQTLHEVVEKNGLTLLEGGRFLHITNGYTKGSAIRWLLSACGDPSDTLSWGLGDGHNDVAMMDAVDQALWVRSPAHAFPEYDQTKKAVYSQHFGPEGWSELAYAHIIPTITTRHAKTRIEP